MKKTLFTLLLITSMVSSNAQFKKEIKTKIHSYKIAFLTEKLDLTEQEAIRFWPVYNDYSKKTTELRRKERFSIQNSIKSSGGIGNISENEAIELLKKMDSIATEKQHTKTAFYKKVSTIISAKKLLLLQISEYEFNKKLMRKLRNSKRKKANR